MLLFSCTLTQSLFCPAILRRCVVGKMYADVRPESDLWLLRHESTFSSLMVDGAPIVPHFSSGNTTQIHAQTFDQRSRGISGPQVSLSEGMPEWMPTGCSCQVDVVGVPTTQTMQNLQYMGRIRLPNLEFVGNQLISFFERNETYYIDLFLSGTTLNFYCTQY